MTRTDTCPVADGIPSPPYIKPKGFLNRLMGVRINGIPEYADSKHDPDVKNTVEYEQFWMKELEKIIHGFWIDDIWIPGRFYYYICYKEMSTIDGPIMPDFNDMHLQLAYYIEYCYYHGKNLLCAKGRRKGISEATSTMVIDYGYRFFPGFKGGVAAGKKDYITDFLDKWRYSDSRVPNEITLQKLSKNDDVLTAGYEEKNQLGVFEEKGTGNTIYARTMHTNPNMFKGLYLNAVISEEVGEHENWKEFYGATKDCLKSGQQQRGVLIAFGTAGNVNKGSKDFKEIWRKPDAYNFVKFMIPAQRFYYYGVPKETLGKHNKERQLPAESELYKKYKPYQLIGCEDTELSLKAILDNRAKLLKGGDMKAYNEDLQNNPVDEKDMFRKTIVNDFNTNKLNDQMALIESFTHPKWTRYKLEWVKDAKGLIKMPYEVTYRAVQEGDDTDECAWIIDTELPRKNFMHLYCAGCLPPDEKVMTEKGLMNIQDVTLDNLLINADGNYVKINELQRYYLADEKMFNVRVSNTLRSTKFTKEHPLFTSKGTRKTFYKRHSSEYKFNEGYWEFEGFEYNRVESVSVGDWIKVPNIYIEPNHFDISKFWYENLPRVDFRIESPLYNPDFWWFVGLWLGDGYCDGRKNKITLCINTKEVEYIERIKSVVKSLFNRSTSFRNRGKGCVEVSFTNKQLVAFLTNYFGKYANGKKIPEWAKHIDENCKKGLITGYLDSDGCIKLEKKRQLYSLGFVSINQELLEAIQDILFSIGIVSNLTLLRDEKIHLFNNRTISSKTKKCYQLRLGHNDTINLVRSLKKDNKNHKLNRVDLDGYKKTRKRANDGCFIDRSKKYIYFQITEIRESLYTGIVYNFDCETHTYMCHHITTHNCDSYDIDTSKTSNSLGAMCVRIRNNNIDGAMKNAPVAVISCRPKRKEAFYELTLKLAVMYNLVGNVLVDIAAAKIMEYWRDMGGWKYLADRPRKFESESSEQGHEKGVRLTNFSRPRMVSLMQTDIEDNVSSYLFPELINQLGNFDIMEIGSDNDLADAHGLSLMQDISFDVKPRDESENRIDDRFDIPVFVGDGEGGVRLKNTGGNTMRNIQQDGNLMGMMFGEDRT